MTTTTGATTAGNGPVVRSSTESPVLANGRGVRRGISGLLVISLIMMLGGSIFASWLNSAAGAASVKDIKIFGTNGYVISAYLYTPKTATPQNPAPAILAIHGLNNQKNYMANTALEFARRGFVVLSMDMTGHGYSTGANGENGFGGPDGLKYLRSLPSVDKNNIG